MNILKKILPPSYACIPLAAVITFNLFAYYGTRLLTRQRLHYSMMTSLDRRIPLCTGFILIYILAYVQWVCGYLLAAHESSAVCRWMMIGDILAKAGALAIFLAIPTTIIRPEIQGRSLCDMLTVLIYRMDAPDNLFPSVHCLESWLCFRTSFRIKKAPRWYPAAGFFFTAAVCASTVLVKQHVLVDIPAGIALAELGLFAAGRILPSRPAEG